MGKLSITFQRQPSLYERIISISLNRNNSPNALKSLIKLTDHLTEPAKEKLG